MANRILNLTLLAAAVSCISAFSGDEEERYACRSVARNSSDTEVTRKGGVRDIPEDNGGNYGDYIYSIRKRGDTLLWRETFINEASPDETQHDLCKKFNKRITQVNKQGSTFSTDRF